MIRRSDRPLSVLLVVLLLAIIAGLGWIGMQVMAPEEAQNATPVPGDEVVEGQNEPPTVTVVPDEGVLPTSVGIAEVLPAQGAQLVGLNPAIMVRFKEPIIEADLLGNQVELPQPIELEPPALGVGQWLAPDYYGFYPSEPLNAGTEYKVSLKSLIAPGMELSEGYNWSFVTQGGQVGASFPYDGAQEVSRSADIRVSFEQPMDRESTQENFKMRDKVTQQPIAGEFVWEDDQTLVFVPETRLQQSSEYEVEVSEGARSKGGSRGLMSPYRATFTTVDFLAVESVQPAPGTIEVPMTTSPLGSLMGGQASMAVQFNHPVVQLVGLADKEGLMVPFEVSPPLAGEGEWVTTSLFVYRATEPLAPSTAYVVTVSDELQDTVASSLAEPYSWSFISEYPRVLRVEPTGRLGPPSDEFYAADEAPEDPRALTVAPNGPIGVRFNQAMEPSSTQSAFSLLTPEGAAIGGRFEWLEEGVLLQFFPETPLTPGASYQILVAAGAQGALGGETREAFELEVTGAAPPAVIESQPVAGEQEVQPTSSINLIFNTELNIKNIEQYIDIQPSVGKISTSFYTPSLQLNIWFNDNFASETSYTVTIDGQLSDKSGQTMGEDYVLTFTTGKLPPRLQLAKARFANLGTFNPAAEPVQLIDYLNISEVDLALYRLTEQEMLRVFDTSEWYEYQGQNASLVASWSIEPDEKSDVGSLASTTLPLEGDQKKGLYFVTAISPNEVDPWSQEPLSDKVMVLFTPVNLTVKQSSDELIVWATSMESGEPLPNTEIHVIIDSQGESRSTIGRGQTDADGIYRYSLPLLDDVNASFMVTSYDGEGTMTGMVRPNWTGTAAAWEFGYTVDSYPLTLYGNLYSERPIYRPGHTVYYKGVLREREGRAFVLPTLQTMTVSLKTYGPEPAIGEASVTLSPFGTFHGAFELPDDLEPAIYRLVLEQEQIGFCTPDYCNYEMVETLIQVAEYQLPEFEVIVEASQNDVVQGETASANVSANYYSGGALTEADVSWRQESRPYDFGVPSLTGYWNWSDNDLVDKFPVSLSQSGSSRLGGSGQVSIELQTLPELDEESEEEQLDRLPISQRVTIAADVEDMNGEVITGDTEMIVHAGEFYIGLNPDSYVGQANQPFSINVATANRAGVLERGHDVTLEFSQREWGSIPASFDFGWDRVFTDTLIATDSTLTDDNGRATLSFTPPEGGAYTVVAIGQDGLGNEIRSRSYFWVTDPSGSVLWGVTQDDRIELAADKDEYQVGDVARILVPTPLLGMTALISEEQLTMGDLSIRTLAGTAEVIEVPITAEMIPNSYINVVAVSGTSAERPAPEFGMGYVKLSVSADPKLLNIEVIPQRSPDAAPPQPGEQVDFKIRVTDAADQPVAAEVSFAMVDKAVLALAEIEQKTLFDSFYSERSLAVQTGSSYTINIDRINETFVADQEAATGGGGGGGPSAVRTEILDTAYWKADLLTDPNGEVAVTIKLPDNLTTWTMIAKAVTKEGPFVGQQQDDLISTKPLIVRPAMPRFLVVGDSLELPVLVQNNTEQGVDALVSVEVTGLTIEEGAATQRIAIGPNGRQVAYFPMTAQEEGPAGIMVRADATAGGLSDAVQENFPVYYPTSPEVVASSSIIRQGEGAALESIQLPEGTNLDQGELTIELAPSLAGATEKTLDWLDNYPYAHVEAVTSRLLALAANLQALRLMESERPELQEKLESELTDALSLLAASQNSDGGWSWWPGNESQPWLTAYVLFGVNEGQKAGLDHTVNTSLARPYLQGWLTETENTQDEETLQTQTFVVYVLSESQNAELAPTLLTHAERLFEKRPLLPAIHATRAYLLLTFTNLGNQQEKVATLASELTSSVHITATGAQWQEEAGATFDSSLRTTAQALRALVRAEPEQLLIQQSVRWLMNARHNCSPSMLPAPPFSPPTLGGKKGGREACTWGSTLDSAYAILALTDYIRQSGERDANFAYEASLNGEVIIREQATSDNLTSPVSVEIALKELLLDRANQLIITQLPAAEGETKSGRLYYSAWLRTFLPISTLAARNQGIAVSRQYEAVDPITQVSTGGLINSATVGDIVQVRLRIEAPHDLPYFTLESPIPAGTEIIDPSLATTASEAIANQKGIERENNPFFHEGWSQEVIRDDQVVLFSDTLPRGSYDYIYWIRATVPGEYNIMPSLAYETYHPELFGRSEGGTFNVTKE